MAVDQKTVERIAELARLEFNEKEKQEIQEDMNRMLSFVSKVEEVNTEGVKPLIYMLEEETPLREDVSESDYTQQDALKNAPDKDSDFIRVPKVLNK
tara:strand:- start:10579 stop:10869 length:291 start_codon:yes stop_codon:yes gene_type:complete